MQKHETHSGSRIYIIFGLIALVAFGGIWLRMHEAWALRDNTKGNATPIVAVMTPAKGAATEDIVLPGNVQAWHEASIYARTNGYLKSWKTDIGAKVKAGDLLAEIDTPEIDAQMRQAAAELKTAEADNMLAQSTASRWNALRKTDSVSKQDADEKESNAASKSAALASARANRDRLTELQSFKQVTAPFDGTITARNTDNGALINAGSGATTAQELFHIADASRLRISVQVPQNYAGAIKPDLTAELHFAEHPGKVYTATLLNTADAISPTSRTLLVTFEADNKDSELLAGGYTEVHLKLPTTGEIMRLPVNTLIFRAEGPQVATVDANNNALLKKITIGRDFGNEVEVKDGLSPDDKVIINPPDSLATGQPVKISVPEKKKEDKQPDGKKP